MRLPGAARLIRLKRTRSTQAAARRMAERGAPAWTVVLAESQTRGKGRIGRTWSSGRGGLYFSFILRPRMKPAELAGLSHAAGHVCARALAEATGLRTMVKPPNDVFALSGLDPQLPRKKVCGILIEASGDTRKVDWVVIGIGVNVNNRIPPDLPHAGSLKALLGRSIDGESLLAKLWLELRRGL